MKKINIVDIVFPSLFISVISAVLADSFYGKTEIAEQYLLGNFLSQISKVSLSLSIIFTVLYLLFAFFLRDLLNAVSETYRYQEKPTKRKGKK